MRFIIFLAPYNNPICFSASWCIAQSEIIDLLQKVQYTILFSEYPNQKGINLEILNEILG